MQKSYYNNAITGNSSMLACLSDKSELLRLFWPNIDYLQQFDKMLCGIFIKNRNGSTVWLNDQRCEHNQEYMPDTNIVKSIITNNSDGYKVIIYDFVHPDRDVLVRRFEIKNILPEQRELGFVAFSAATSADTDIACSLFDFYNEALIHYRSNNYIAIFSDKPAFQFQIGNNANEAAVNTYLFGKEDIGMMKDAAVSWDLGTFAKNETKGFNLYITAGGTLRLVKGLIKEVKSIGAALMLNQTEQYWKDFLNKANQIKSGNDRLDSLYRRSLLVFRLMYDKKSGGLLAAPEVDEYFTRCGRYAYCWGRDAAFITGALDIAGLNECVDNFYKWAVNVQDEDGSWQQRYHMDGNLAPCWGLQIDETGTLLWGMLNHFNFVRRLEFLQSVWSSVEKGADFLIRFIDEATGLPKPSFDLWEERYGEHAYSSASVYAGLVSAAEIAKILGKPVQQYTKWKDTAAGIKQAIVKCFWKEDYKRFIRSVRVKLNGWGTEPSQSTTMIEINPKGYMRDVTLEDWKVDVSLVGLSIPFGVFDANDIMIKDTVLLIEQVLTSEGVGGIKRYENDSYIGGNPWVLTTLWVALYHTKTGNYLKAKEYLYWAADAKTDMGLLPEQRNKYTGKADWIIPLTWSHAMYVHVLSELVKAGVL
ncbi:oligosaccharide amylase [Ruminiclostridium sufflavum DSM 19573]|uniref:Oligosaccharide amylase n=1 Tax=Ruminiclostridium sufflavum DSM 19573 TaxID=1121337 RepID=A0A318XL60_9FIRM|nr:glycoside hydrolase family 15 protein [Ruminiclostridium sufflavum]PYG87984.1 oligosaccharide amylase [Ruminiclostridium sufflavum DSM 19573]